MNKKSQCPVGEKGKKYLKCNKVRNRERNDTLCVMCEEKKETLKHLLCSCKMTKCAN